MSSAEEFKTLRAQIKEPEFAYINENLRNGRMVVPSKEVAPFLGCTKEALANAIREGKVHFGFCHRSEKATSWTTLVDLVKYGDWRQEYCH